MAVHLPLRLGNTEPWQRAAKVPHQAAEHGGPFVFMARINFYRAIYGDRPPPIGNPKGKKGRRWGKRRLARDSEPVKASHFDNSNPAPIRAVAIATPAKNSIMACVLFYVALTSAKDFGSMDIAFMPSE